MPAVDSWVQITTRLVDIVLIVILIIILLICIFIIFYRQSRKIKQLNSEISELSGKIETSEGGLEVRESTSAREAYLKFIYNVSHEISNPLQSIQINLENLENSTSESEGHWKQTYTIIFTELKRLFKLTESLRLLSQLESKQTSVRREPVNLKSVMEDIIMAEADRALLKNIRLAYRGPERPARVLGDRDQLRQVVSNLVDNSIKYAKDGGGEIIISLQEDGDHIIVRVSDEGIGISEEDLPFVFDTAYRSPTIKSVKRAGSGLGLAITKRIIEQHNGDIRVQSKLGEGTTVLLNLTVYKPSI
jgi:histidine kinase